MFILLICFGLIDIFLLYGCMFFFDFGVLNYGICVFVFFYYVVGFFVGCVDKGNLLE